MKEKQTSETFRGQMIETVEKPKNKRKVQRRFKPIWWFLGFIALVVVGVCGLFMVGWGNSYAICFGTPFPSYRDVEQAALFELPGSASDVEFDADGLNGCTIWVNFQMDAQEFESFKESTLVREFEPELLTDSAFVSFLQQKRWSQTERTPGGHTSTSTDGIPVVQWVFFETLESGQYHVYIITNKEWL